MKKLPLIMLLFICWMSTVYAFNIRNTYTTRLICIQAVKPHKIYNIAPHSSSVQFKDAGKYRCTTSDEKYISTCSVSDIQPTATFNTNDGSASCSTPAKIR